MAAVIMGVAYAAVLVVVLVLVAYADRKWP